MITKTKFDRSFRCVIRRERSEQHRTWQYNYYFRDDRTTFAVKSTRALKVGLRWLYWPTGVDDDYVTKKKKKNLATQTRFSVGSKRISTELPVPTRVQFSRFILKSKRYVLPLDLTLENNFKPKKKNAYFIHENSRQSRLVRLFTRSPPPPKSPNSNVCTKICTYQCCARRTQEHRTQ